jgi:hypothetical protein
MKNFAEFLVSKSITEETMKTKTAEEVAGLYNEFNELKRTELDKAIAEKASKADIDSLKSELSNVVAEQVKTLNEVLKAQGVTIKKLSEAEKTAGEGMLSSVRKGLNKNLDKLKSLKETRNAESITFKVAGTMLESTNITGEVPAAQYVAGFDVVPSRRVRLMDIVQSGVAQSNIIRWISQANKDGAAGQTAEGNAKNQIDFDLVTGEESLRKTTAYIKVSTEMLEDVDFIESEINNELMREVLKAVETQVYSGDGTGNNLNGIVTQASAFVATTAPVAVENANFVDVLRTASTQIKLAEHDAPNYILANPTDVLGLLQIKRSTTDKAYIDALQMVAGQLSLDGIPIIETTLVAADSYLIGDFTKATVYSKGMIDVELGLDGSDFTNNTRTILAEWRGANVIRTNDASAFVTGTISVDAAALEAIV